MERVVIDKKLFSRVIKDRKAKTKEKDDLKKMDDEHQKEVDKLKAKLVEKLGVLVNGKISQGVYNNFKEEAVPKGTKFAPKILMEVDYTNVNPNKWTTDKEKNELVKTLINNFIIKNKEILGIYNRKKFVAVVGD